MTKAVPRGVASIMLAAWVCGAAFAQYPARPIPKITSITVDPAIPVVGPDHTTNINVYPNYGLSTLADEHSTIFPPQTLGRH